MVAVTISPTWRRSKITPVSWQLSVIMEAFTLALDEDSETKAGSAVEDIGAAPVENAGELPIDPDKPPAIVAVSAAPAVPAVPFHP